MEPDIISSVVPFYVGGQAQILCTCVAGLLIVVAVAGASLCNLKHLELNRGTCQIVIIASTFEPRC